MIYDEEHYNQVLAVAKSYRNDAERLEKQIIEKNKEIEELKLNNKELQQQLKEKDEELNKYAELFEMKDKDFYVIEKTEYEKMKFGVKEIIEQAVKYNTKRIFEKIRDDCKLSGYEDNYYYKTLVKVLKQIEKES